MTDDGYRNVLQQLGGEGVTVTVDLGIKRLCVLCEKPGTNNDIGVRISRENGELVIEGYAHPTCVERFLSYVLSPNKI